MKTTFEVKNTWDEMNVRLYMAIEKIIEPTAIAIETSQNEAHRPSSLMLPEKRIWFGPTFQ